MGRATLRPREVATHSVCDDADADDDEDDQVDDEAGGREIVSSSFEKGE